MRIFGGILIATGVACLGFTALLLLGKALNPSQRWEPALLYAAFAAACFALGFGSYRGRRWARALTLIGSAATLSWTVLGAPFILWMVGRSLAADPTLSSARVSMGCVLAPLIFMMFVLTLVPLAFLIFYARHDVRLTVERLDPAPDWTDRQPVPLLAAAIVCGLTAVVWLPGLLNPVIPIPGTIVTGNAARALIVAFAVGWGVIGWGLYRGRRAALLSAVALTVLVTLFWLRTLMTFDLVAVGRAMGVTEEQLDVMRKLDLRPGLFALTTVTALAWSAYLVWIRKYLPSERGPASQ